MLNTVGRVSEWAKSRKCAGLAHGWCGWAWVWLHLLKRGLIREEGAVFRAIRRRMEEELRTPPPTDYTSPMLGSGAAPVVAALASSLLPGFRSFLRPAIDRWIAHCATSSRRDLMLGSAGDLLACSEIEGYAPAVLPRTFIRRTHQRCIETLSQELSEATAYLGLSHGLAGFLLALHVGEATLRLPFPDRLRAACLTRLAEERLEGPGRAAAWPMFSGTPGIVMQSWCHGAPGIGLALIHAFRLSGRGSYRDLAEVALRGAHRFRTVADSFCCGTLGRAQILLEAYRITDQDDWRRKAMKVAAEADLTRTPRSVRKRGFHQGRLGGLYLQWRLLHPKELPLPCLGALSC